MSFNVLSNPIAWMTPFLLIGLLLFPATCTEASMVHSIFTDPSAFSSDEHRHENHAAYADAYGISEAELDLHVALGHIVLPEAGQDREQIAVVVSDVDPCLQGPKLRSLPQEMMINVATVIAVVDDLTELPILLESQIVTQIPVFLTGTSARVELPPPQKT